MAAHVSAAQGAFHMAHCESTARTGKKAWRELNSFDLGTASAEVLHENLEPENIFSKILVKKDIQTRHKSGYIS